MQLISSPQSVTAAFLLGKATLSLFPKAQLIGADVWGTYFVYRFLSDYPVQKEQLMPLQEALYTEAGQISKVESVEMIASNAKELFKHQRQFEIQKKLPKAPQEIVSLLRADSHYDLQDGSPMEQFKGKVFLSKVFSIPDPSSKREQFLIEVWGTAAAEMNELKAQKKFLNAMLKALPIEKGKALGFLDEVDDLGIFYSKGLNEIRALKKDVRQAAESMNFEEFAIEEFDQKRFEKFLFNNQSPQKSQVRFWTLQRTDSQANPFFKNQTFCSSHQKIVLGIVTTIKELGSECNYCLKFLLKIFKILGFSYEAVFCVKTAPLYLKQALVNQGIIWREGALEKAADLRINFIDQWGRQASAFNLKLKEKKQGAILYLESLLTFEDLFFWKLQNEASTEL